MATPARSPKLRSRASHGLLRGAVVGAACAIALPGVAEAQLSRKGFHVGFDGAVAFASPVFEAPADMYVQPSFLMNYRMHAIADFQMHVGMALRYPLGEDFVAIGGAIEPGFLFHLGPTYTTSLRALVTASALTDGSDKFLLGFEGHLSPVGFGFGKHHAQHIEFYGTFGFLSGFASGDSPVITGGGGLRYGGLFL